MKKQLFIAVEKESYRETCFADILKSMYYFKINEKNKPIKITSKTFKGGNNSGLHCLTITSLIILPHKHTPRVLLLIHSFSSKKYWFKETVCSWFIWTHCVWPDFCFQKTFLKSELSTCPTWCTMTHYGFGQIRAVCGMWQWNAQSILPPSYCSLSVSAEAVVIFMVQQ